MLILIYFFRPEEGDDPRSRLCKLLTSPVDAVATLVAEFLFVLCKESGETSWSEARGQSA